MPNYRFEDIQDSLDELEGKYRAICGITEWISISDPTYGSCYYQTIAHNIGPFAMFNNITCWDMTSNSQIFPLDFRAVNNSTSAIYMPSIPTFNILVVIN